MQIELRFFQVISTSVGFQKTSLIILSRKPSRVRNLFTIVEPVEVEVWVGVALSLVFVSVALWLIAHCEEGIVHSELKDWSTMRKSSWYAFATLLGESVTRDTSSARAWGLR